MKRELKEGPGLGGGIGPCLWQAAQGLGEAQGPSQVSDARTSFPLSTEGALTFKAWVKEGPFQPTETHAPPMATPHVLPLTVRPVRVCLVEGGPWEPGGPARASSGHWTRRGLRARRCCHGQV